MRLSRNPVFRYGTGDFTMKSASLRIAELAAFFSATLIDAAF
jgi:hypothetical protein